jgi:hypothetical protein
MATEADLWQKAWIIVEQFGAEGVEFAPRMASSFQNGGNTEAHEAWISIIEKIGTLTSTSHAAVQ